MFGRPLQISITLCVCCMCCGFQAQTKRNEISMYTFVSFFSAVRAWFFAHIAANVCVRRILSNIQIGSVCKPNDINIIIIIIWNWIRIEDQNVQILRSEINYRYHTYTTYLNRLSTNLSSNNAVIIFNDGEVGSLFWWILCRIFRFLSIFYRKNE